VITVLLLTTSILNADEKKPAPSSKFDCTMTNIDRSDAANNNINIISADPGCKVDQPARCQGTHASSAVVCKENYKDCPVSSGCLDPAEPLRCVTGECVKHIAFCPIDKNRRPFAPECPDDAFTKFKRCPDGFCRPAGACECVQWSGCPFNRYQCPDGTCMETFSQCGTMGFCEENQPWSCGGFECVENPPECPNRYSDGSFTNKSYKYEPSNALQQSITDSDFTSITMKNILNFRTSLIVKFIDDTFYGYYMGPWWSKTTPAPKRILANISQKKNRHLQSVAPVTPPVTPEVTPDATDNDHKNSVDFKTFKMIKNEGKSKWDIERTLYTKEALKGPVEIYFDSVGTSALKAVKNKMSEIDIWYMSQILNIALPKGYLPLVNTLYSVPVKIYTKGRLDDNEWFNSPVWSIFTLNSELVVDPSMKSERRSDDKKNIFYYKNVYCLAFVNNGEWTCVNRNMTEINVSTKAKLPRDRRTTLGYYIPFPGTFAVIFKPAPNFLMQMRMKNGALNEEMGLLPGGEEVSGLTDSMNEYIGLIYISIGVIICALFFSSQLLETVKKSRVEANTLRYKKDLAIRTEPDYCGQGVIQKLQENVRYYDNPMLIIEDNELAQVIAANKEDDNRMEDMLKKQGQSLEQRSVYKSTIREVKDQKASQKSGNDKGKWNPASLKKGMFASHHTRVWRIAGRSPSGTSAIQVIGIDSDDENDEGMNANYPQVPEPVQEVAAEQEIEVAAEDPLMGEQDGLMG
jgi:hypothetical protein